MGHRPAQRSGAGIPVVSPSALAFDIDGVIADTMRLFLDIAREDFGLEGIRYEDITSYALDQCLPMDEKVITAITEKILNGGYSSVLHPMDGAGDVLCRLGRFHRPILLVTARPYPGPMAEWIRETLYLEEDVIDLVTTGTYEAKAGVLLGRNVGYFVEDRLETCFDLHQRGISPIVYRQPWNRKPHPFIEVGNWQELESLIDFQ